MIQLLEIRIESLENVSTGLEASTSGTLACFGVKCHIYFLLNAKFYIYLCLKYILVTTSRIKLNLYENKSTLHNPTIVGNSSSIPNQYKSYLTKHLEPSWEISPEIGVITSHYGTTNRLFSNKTLIRPIFGVAIVRNIHKNYKIKLQTDFVRIGEIDKYYNPFVAGIQYQDDFILPYIQSDLSFNSKLNLKRIKFSSLSFGVGVFLGKILTPYITTKIIELILVHVTMEL
jgi:hypothetical protein